MVVNVRQSHRWRRYLNQLKYLSTEGYWEYFLFKHNRGQRSLQSLVGNELSSILHPLSQRREHLAIYMKNILTSYRCHIHWTEPYIFLSYCICNDEVPFLPNKAGFIEQTPWRILPRVLLSEVPQISGSPFPISPILKICSYFPTISPSNKLIY